jgi:FtsP/CotA-like multicopper oxidase with cupredoxin domain
MKHRNALLRFTLPWTILALSTCGRSGADSSRSNDPPVLETPGAVPITDLNDLPNVVEVQLVASPGEVQYLPAGPAKVWGYRDGAKPGSPVTVPGPLIQVKQGDRVIVHLKNELPEGTTIHWHGLRVPNRSDGTPSTQAEVPPGGKFRYEFTAHDEGTFWYHPHVRGDTQVERGLYGMLIVHGGPRVDVAAERALVLDDVKLNAKGELSDSTTSLDIMVGRIGNHFLVNGIPEGTIKVMNGARERWRLVNTANGRYFKLRLPGHSFRVIGWDGGLLAEPYSTDALLITPGERYDVLVELTGAVGSVVTLESVHYDRGHSLPDAGPQPLLKLAIVANVSKPPAPLPPVWGAPVELAAPANATGPELELEEETIKDGQDVRFTINGKPFPEVPPIAGREGDVQVWTIHNETEMDHPIHLHGMFFRVLDVNGVAPAHIGWKDTVNVPQKAKLRFVVQYGDPGVWMYHCHILEHAERGMMGELHLSPRNGPPLPDAGAHGAPHGGGDAGVVDGGGADGGGFDGERPHDAA